VTSVIRKSSEKTKILFQAHIGGLHLGMPFGKLPLGDIKTREWVTPIGIDITKEGGAEDDME